MIGKEYEKMDVVSMTRELGKAIQADARYTAYAEAKAKQAKDTELSALMGKLSLVQMSYQQEAQSDAPDEDRMNEYDREFQALYSEIMAHPVMNDFQQKKQAVDDMMNYLIQILNLTVNGADPMTCDPQAEEECTGSCATCGGCS